MKVWPTLLTILILSTACTAHATDTCGARFARAGLNPEKLLPGAMGRLEGQDFIIANGDTPDKICSRVDATKTATATLQTQLNLSDKKLEAAQERITQMEADDNPFKKYYVWSYIGLYATSLVAVFFFVLAIFRKR